MSAEPSPAVKSKIAQIFAARKLNQRDRTFLMTALSSSRISDADEALINQIYDAIAAGKINVVA